MKSPRTKIIQQELRTIRLNDSGAQNIYQIAITIIEILKGCIIVVPASHSIPKCIIPDKGTPLHGVFQFLGQWVGIQFIQ